MKTILKYLTIALTALAFSSCQKPASEPVIESLAVTPTNINGSWKLIEWNGQPLPDGRYVYIEFTRRDMELKSYENTSTAEVH